MESVAPRSKHAALLEASRNPKEASEGNGARTVAKWEKFLKQLKKGTFRHCGGVDNVLSYFFCMPPGSKHYGKERLRQNEKHLIEENTVCRLVSEHWHNI